MPRVADKHGRIARLLAIVQALSDAPATRADLAARFGVSVRTIGTDLRQLRAAGVVIERTPAGFVVIERREATGPGPTDRSASATMEVVAVCEQWLTTSIVIDDADLTQDQAQAIRRALRHLSRV